MSLLRINGLVKDYPIRAGVFGGSSGTVRAVDHVSLKVEEGRTFGLVGEFGLRQVDAVAARPSAGDADRRDGASGGIRSPHPRRCAS